MRWFLAAVLVFVLGCPLPAVPVQASISCQKPEDCPRDFDCAVARARCIRPGESLVPRLFLLGLAVEQGVRISWVEPEVPVTAVQLMRADLSGMAARGHATRACRVAAHIGSEPIGAVGRFLGSQ